MEFEAIGTHWRITSSKDLHLIQKKILDRIETFDAIYSRFRTDSLVSQMATAQGIYSLPSDAQALLDFYIKLYDVTTGLVTPLIGRTLEQAGYDAEYSLKTGVLTSPPEWNKALRYEFPELEILQPVMLDFGAAGKGYLIDIIGCLLESEGIEDFCINAGGDILVKGALKRIGLENPDDTTQAVGIVELKSGALCGSAGSRRHWNGFHHTINPKTLKSPVGIKAIWVTADTAMLADGLATALYFTDAATLRQLFTFEYAMIKGDEIERSKGFKAEIFK